MKTSLLSAVVFSSLLFSSYDLRLNRLDQSGGFLLDPAWDNVFSWSSKQDKLKKLVFRQGDFRLYADAEKLNYSLNLIKNNLVMVSSSKYTVLGRNLHQHPNAVAIFPTNFFYDYVLIAPTSNEDRDEIARLAHEDLAACGSIEGLSLDDTVVTTLPSALSPIFSTTVKLPTAATLADKISATNIQTNDKALEALGTRYHAGANSATAVAKVKSMWQAVLPTGATLTEFSNNGVTTQNNVVLTIPGTKDDSTTLIIGAHLDSINRSDQTSAPGADDDASGIATLTEIIRVIHDSGATFQRRIEFHAYAAEEVGLYGSAQMAKSYAASGRKIVGMLQMDMNAYSTSDNTNKIFLVSTDTSGVLRRGLKDLLDLYLGGNYTEMSLAASSGTSDHKSWTNNGFHTVFPFEHPQNYNKTLHTTQDVSSILDFNLSARFGKMATLWLSHGAGLTSVSTEYDSGLSTLNTAAANIKIAEVATTSTASKFAVAAPTTASTIVSCPVTTATAAGCSKDPTEYSLSRSSSTKAFFSSSTEVTLSDGDYHRFIAYDANGLAIAQRTIQLKKK